ncbi:YihY/virulence factor BrkB family protein, partial [Streptomyces roseolus]
MYGAFGVPIALLLWINFTAKLVLVCAAWTATPLEEGGPREADADAGEGGSEF